MKWAVRKLGQMRRLSKRQQIHRDICLFHHLINSRHLHRVEAAGAGSGDQIVQQADFGWIVFLGFEILERCE